MSQFETDDFIMTGRNSNRIKGNDETASADLSEPGGFLPSIAHKSLTRKRLFYYQPF